MPSSFRLADPASATWSIGTDRACATNGRTFVQSLQNALGVTVDGQWGANTSSAVVAQMRAAGMPSAIVNAAQNEAVNHRVGNFLLIGAVYIVMRDVQSDPVQLGQIVLPSDVVAPLWNVAAPGDGNAGISCVQQVPLTPDATTPVETPSVDAGATGGTGPTTIVGPTIDITGSVPPPRTPAAPPRVTSGVSAGLVLFVVGAVVVTSLMFTKKKGRGR